MTRFLIVPIPKDGEDEEPTSLLEKVDAKAARLKDEGKIRIFEIETSDDNLDVMEVDSDGSAQEIPFKPLW